LSGLSNHNCERSRGNCGSGGLPFFAITLSRLFLHSIDMTN
jgi:hypothetical protein